MLTRKLASAILSMAIVVALVPSAFALAHTSVSVSSIDALPSSSLYALSQAVKTDLDIAEVYAYLDISSASPAAAEIILAARENIIYHNSWYDRDSCTGAVLTDKEGNVVRELEAFQDIFPADWDVPTFQKDDEISMAIEQELSAVPYGYSLNTVPYNNVPIPYANTSSKNYADVVCKTTGENTVGQMAVSIPFNVNLAITNLVDKNVTWVTDVEKEQILWANGIEGYGYGMRVSTFEDNWLGLTGSFVTFAIEF